MVVPGVWQGLTVAPAIGTTLASVRDELVGVTVGRESRLRKALQREAGAYDLVLIDCPPELGLLTINGLVAATDAVVVTEAKLFAVEGVAGILDTIETVRSHYNPRCGSGARSSTGTRRQPSPAAPGCWSCAKPCTSWTR